MTEDLWETSVLSLMLRAPNQRATHYREQAKRLREHAEAETNPKLRGDLAYLADQYDGLANSVT
jgi:hypothetical protein